MTGKKVKLAFIVDAAARKAAYKKRSKNVLKKVEEISTLCGIEACGIIYGPYEPEPEIWPSNDGIHSTLMKFMSKTELQRGKNKLNQEDYVRQRISKAEDKITKLRNENRKDEMKLVMCESLRDDSHIDLNKSSLNDLNDLSWFIDSTLKDIDRQMEQLQLAPPQLPPPPPPPAPTPSNAETTMMMNQGHNGMTGNNDAIMQPGPNGEETIPFGQPNDGNLEDEFWSSLPPLP